MGEFAEYRLPAQLEVLETTPLPDLVESRADSKGVTVEVYRPTGRPEYATATAD